MPRRRPTGILDSATVSQALIALCKSESAWTEWDWKSLATASLLLMHGDITLPPRRGEYHGLWSVMPHHLGGQTRGRLAFHKRHADLEEKTLRWAGRKNVRYEIANAVKSSVRQPSFAVWFNDHVRLIWRDDVRMHGELFNGRFLHAIAACLDCGMPELQNLHSRTCDLPSLEAYARSQDAYAENELLAHAYLTAGIMRGHYHRLLAKEWRLNLAVHPYRRDILVGKSNAKMMDVSTLDYEIAVRIICSSLLCRKPQDRVNRWAEAIKSYCGLNARDLKTAAGTALTPGDAESQADQIVKKMNLPIRRLFSVRDVLPASIRIGAHPFGLGASVAAELFSELIHFLPHGPTRFERKYKRILSKQPRLIAIERAPN
jgi:hypothetical protein